MPPSRSSKPLVVVSLAAFALFGGVAWSVHVRNELTQFDAHLAEALHAFTVERPETMPVFRCISALAGGYVMSGLLAVAALLLLRRRDYGLAAVWVVAVVGGGFVNEGLKHLFERPRPPLAQPTVPGWSFPSGHAMRAMIAYGFLACLLYRLLPRRGLRLSAVIVLATVIVLVGFSRMYLGCHYCSDVIGSFAFGAGWLAAWLACLRGLTRKNSGSAASATNHFR